MTSNDPSSRSASSNVVQRNVARPAATCSRFRSARRVDHLLRPVDPRQVTAVAEPLAHQRRRHAVAAAQFEHAVARLDAERVDRRALPLRCLRCHAP